MAASTQDFRLLCVGGVDHPRKGAQYLFDAVAKLREGGSRVTVDVVGGGTHEGLPSFVRQHRDVSTQNLAALYRSCDAFVAPATGQESFGIILLEAMASGKPIIASNIDGYRRVLCDGREKGALIVPPKDVAALAHNIAHMMALPACQRLEMGAHNRASITPFTWDRVCQQVRDIYLMSMASRERGTPRP